LEIIIKSLCISLFQRERRIIIVLFKKEKPCISKALRLGVN